MKRINSLTMFEKVKLAETIREILVFENRCNHPACSLDDYVFYESEIEDRILSAEQLLECELCEFDVRDIAEKLKSDKEFLKKYNRICKSELWRKPI